MFIGEVQSSKHDRLGTQLGSFFYATINETLAYDTLMDQKADCQSLEKSTQFSGLADDSLMLQLSTDNLSKYFAACDLIFFRDATNLRNLRHWWLGVPNNLTSTSQSELVLRVIIRAAMISHWATVEVLHLCTRSKRAQMIDFLINLAKVCYLIDA